MAQSSELWKRKASVNILSLLRDLESDYDVVSAFHDWFFSVLDYMELKNMPHYHFALLGFPLKLLFLLIL